MIMKKLVLSATFFAAGCVWLSGCNNAGLEERVATLEDRLTELENGSSVPSQPTAFTETSDGTETPAAPAGPATTISFEETTHEFGTINEGDIVEHTFAFTNTGDSPLIIQDARATCGCTIPKKPEGPVAPGESSEIQVRFNSQGKSGMQNKTITITANTEPSTTRLFIKADVTPKGEPVAGPVKK